VAKGYLITLVLKYLGIFEPGGEIHQLAVPLVDHLPDHGDLHLGDSEGVVRREAHHPALAIGPARLEQPVSLVNLSN